MTLLKSIFKFLIGILDYYSLLEIFFVMPALYELKPRIKVQVFFGFIKGQKNR